MAVLLANFAPACPAIDRRLADSLRRRAGFAFILCCTFLHTGALSAGPSDSPLGTLLTTRAVRELSAAKASAGYPVRVRAVVTYYDPSPDPHHSILFIADDSGSIYVNLNASPATRLQAGDLVDVTGISGPGQFAPVIDRALALRIRTTHLPSIARQVTMAEMLTGEEDGQWVEIQGVVRALRSSGKYLYLDVAMRDGDITAMTVDDGKVDYHSLVDATVTIRGNEGTVFNNQRQMTGAHILFPGMNSLSVVEAAPTHPFDEALEQVGSLLHFSSAASLHHRVHVRGTVTLNWPGELLCIRDGEHGLCAQTEQTTRVNRGDRVDLVGFPVIGPFSPALDHATYQAAGRRQAFSPETVTADQILKGGYDAQLVTIRGRLIGHDLSAADPTIVLSTGTHLFSAVMPREYLAQDLKLEEGSLLNITGVCSTQSDGSKWDPRSGFPSPTSFRILRGSPADTVIVAVPSWWNAVHTLRVLALALVMALGALCGVFVLGQRVKRQNSTIRRSEERFRHLATHDSLTQLPNRASVLNSLEYATQKARKEGSSVCIALIDLDHFKRINDELGHLVGDEVLRESARRLASSIRTTDFIGRYGGEEFLIVFQDMDLENGAARCEIVRRALCDQPIRWHDGELTITCSVGVAAAKITHNPVTTLISVADQAMYAAKTLGRNRVVRAPISMKHEQSRFAVSAS